MKVTDKIFVAGHAGLIGSAVVRGLRRRGFDNVLLVSHADLDLAESAAVESFFEKHSPAYVVLAAGRVGGIAENRTYPADFMDTNLAIQLNVFRAARKRDVQKLIFFGSSCMYPRDCPQPMAETALLSGYPEPTSLPYAVAKLAGLQMCLAYNQQHGRQRFIPLIPNSVYGPNDNFDPQTGHVLSSLLRRFHDAHHAQLPSVTLWGSGKPRREFVHADDLAEACMTLLTADTATLALPLNVGSGQDYSIRELAAIVARIVGYAGEIKWDTSKPDGAPRKLLDSSRLRAAGWRPTVDFEQGLRGTYEWFCDNIADTETRL